MLFLGCNILEHDLVFFGLIFLFLNFKCTGVYFGWDSCSFG